MQIPLGEVTRNTVDTTAVSLMMWFREQRNTTGAEYKEMVNSLGPLANGGGYSARLTDALQTCARYAARDATQLYVASPYDHIVMPDEESENFACLLLKYVIQGDLTTPQQRHRVLIETILYTVIVTHELCDIVILYVWNDILVRHNVLPIQSSPRLCSTGVCVVGEECVNGDCKSDKEILAHHHQSWTLLHAWVDVQSRSQSLRDDSKQNRSYLCAFASNYPCSTCGAHMQQYVDRFLSPKVLEDPIEFRNWIVQFHNSVNYKLGKPLYPDIPLLPLM